MALTKVGKEGITGISNSSDANAITIDSSENVGIGNASPAHLVDATVSSGSATARFGTTHNSGANNGTVIISNGGSGDAMLRFDYEGSNTDRARIGVTSSGQQLEFYTGGDNERMRIEANNVLFGKTVSASSTNGVSIGIGTNEGFVSATNSSDPVLYLNRQSSDGTLAQFRHADTTEGTISISGTTVSYNGGHLSRWSQATDGNRIDGLVKGTVMTNLDQMAEWTKDGVTEDNEQLNCMAVSSVEGDANVAGVFVNWDDDDTDYTADMNIAMTGDMVIRIAQGTTVARGDLLMSAGDGTAKPQGDDIVRSKTIAKVTSTTVSHTYDDGTFLVPCVLMAC